MSFPKQYGVSRELSRLQDSLTRVTQQLEQLKRDLTSLTSTVTTLRTEYDAHAASAVPPAHTP